MTLTEQISWTWCTTRLCWSSWRQPKGSPGKWWTILTLPIFWSRSKVALQHISTKCRHLHQPTRFPPNHRLRMDSTVPHSICWHCHLLYHQQVRRLSLQNKGVVQWERSFFPSSTSNYCCWNWRVAVGQTIISFFLFPFVHLPLNRDKYLRDICLIYLGS